MAHGVILPWQGSVEGLGDRAGEMPLWSGTLADCAAAALASAGLAAAGWRPGEEAVVVAGGCALRPEAARAALALGREEGRDLALGLGGRAGALAAEAALGLEGGGLWYLAPGGAAELQARLAEAAAVTLDPDERTIELPFPGQPVTLHISGRLFLPVRHWLTLLWANLMGLGPYLWGALLSERPALAALRGAAGAVRAMSLQPERVAAALSLRRGAKVHRAATVEAAVLGPGARVEAGAVVRGCVLGAGAVVESGAICEGSVLGPGALVQRQAMVKFCALGPGASVGGVLQLGVCGPGAHLKRGSFAMDLALEGAVRVRVGAGLAPAPLGMAGACLGDGALIGSGVWIAPGRAVPPGVMVVREAVLSDPSADGPGVYRVRGGRLEPV